MELMNPSMLLLLVLVVSCYCAPSNWLDVGGTVGYDSSINGTIGGHLKATRDGLSVDGTGKGIVAASWTPEVIARGHASVGDKIIAGGGSLKANISNSWQPSVQGELGINSKGELVAGIQPASELNNTLILTPRLQVKTGDDARRLVGLPVAADKEPVKIDPKTLAAALAYIQSLSEYQESQQNIY